MRELHQLHLYLKDRKGFSGRGVRIREVTPDIKDAATVAAAKEAGENRERFGTQVTREVMIRSIVAITAPDTLPEKLVEAKWEPVTEMELQLPGPKNLTSLFTNKDFTVIDRYIDRNFFASAAEAEMIMGGAVAVSED